jgi:hypothetical protein
MQLKGGGAMIRPARGIGPEALATVNEEIYLYKLGYEK